MDAKKPIHPMRFQTRDGEILQTIFNYDGVMAKRHLRRLFWPTATSRHMERRLSKLYHNDYLSRPNAEQRRTKPIPKPIVWLSWKGVLRVAGRSGVSVDLPTSQRENEMRRLAKQLREQGIRWQREPRWTQLEHDLAVANFRLAAEQEVSRRPSLTLEEWVPEGVFLSKMDVVKYEIQDRAGLSRHRKKGVRPDAYFVIVNEHLRSRGVPARQRLLLELDMATHPNPRFGREKVSPGVAYIRSPEYKARFGFNSGRWLVVTTGCVRMRNLMCQTQQEVGISANLFFFTTRDQAETGSVLTDHIWWRVGRDTPAALFQP